MRLGLHLFSVSCGLRRYCRTIRQEQLGPCTDGDKKVLKKNEAPCPVPAGVGRQGRGAIVDYCPLYIFSSPKRILRTRLAWWWAAMPTLGAINPTPGLASVFWSPTMNILEENRIV